MIYNGKFLLFQWLEERIYTGDMEGTRLDAWKSMGRSPGPFMGNQQAPSLYSKE
jgi:hypothetical protein